jgi:hypothetical protein
MLQMFYLDVAKVDLGSCVVVEPTCRSHLLAAIGPVHVCGSRGGASGRREKQRGCRLRRSPHVGACMHGKRSGMGPYVKQART